MDNQILQSLQQTIQNRKAGATEKSYVASLLQAGPTKINDKMIEEARECVEASQSGDANHLVYEVADLWFHSLVLLNAHDKTLDDLLHELARREGVSGLVEKAGRKNHE